MQLPTIKQEHKRSDQKRPVDEVEHIVEDIDRIEQVHQVAEQVERERRDQQAISQIGIVRSASPEVPHDRDNQRGKRITDAAFRPPLPLDPRMSGKSNPASKQPPRNSLIIHMIRRSRVLFMWTTSLSQPKF